MTSPPSRLPGTSALLLGVLLLGGACRSAEPTGPSAGSETHFLSWCSGSAACGEGLECFCGVCTRACSNAAGCESLAGSSASACLASSAHPLDQGCADSPASVCDVVCIADVDCAGVGATARCDRGFCRQLSPSCGAGQTAAGDVAVLGDSFLAESGQVSAELTNLARASGSLQADEQYRDYSSIVITPFGGPADLTAQYAAALTEGAPRVIVMNAGGPDALLVCPEPPAEDCPALAAAVARASDLWSQMASDGVEAVVDFFYPDPDDATLKAKFDVLRPMMQAACASSAVPCHFLDLRTTFDGHADDYLNAGGITPTETGSTATAAALWSLMQQRCLAQ